MENTVKMACIAQIVLAAYILAIVLAVVRIGNREGW